MAVEDRTASMVRLKAVLLVALDAKIAEMEDDMFDRLALSESKGQKLLQESVQNAKADAQGDIRDAVSKKDSEWKKAAEEVRKLHGAELEKVQAFAEQGIKAAEGKMEAAVRLEKMQGEERQKHAVSLAVEASEAIANARIADTATAHTKELTRMVANMRQERAQWLSERDRIRQQASEAKDKAVAEAVAAVQTMADIALRNQKEEAAQEQEEAVRAFQEESEKIISRIEEAMENLNAEKENLVANLEETKAQLEEAEDTLFDCQNDLQTSMKTDALHTFKLTVRLVHLKEKSKKELEQTVADWTERHEKATKIHEARSEDYEKDIQKLSNIAKAAEEREQDIRDTLMNHKRETLMQHKIKSTVFASVHHRTYICCTLCLQCLSFFFFYVFLYEYLVFLFLVVSARLFLSFSLSLSVCVPV